MYLWQHSASVGSAGSPAPLHLLWCSWPYQRKAVETDNPFSNELHTSHHASTFWSMCWISCAALKWQLVFTSPAGDIVARWVTGKTQTNTNQHWRQHDDKHRQRSTMLLECCESVCVHVFGSLTDICCEGQVSVCMEPINGANSTTPRPAFTCSTGTHTNTQHSPRHLRRTFTQLVIVFNTTTTAHI